MFKSSENKEALTHSDRYVRKTNAIILSVGIIFLFLFMFGLLLTGIESESVEEHYEIESNIDAETNFGLMPTSDEEAEIEFDEAQEAELPITTTPNPINMGQVILGNEASNVLTIGTNGKSAIKILSVDLEDAAFMGFSFETNCKGKELRGKVTCNVTMKWSPSAAENVQNNFKIIWHETNVSDTNAKHIEVPVYGNAVEKQDCNFCDTSVNGNAGENGDLNNNNTRFAVGPDGRIIGIIDEDGIVRDANGNEIGRVNADGLVVDKDGNVIGVASSRKMILDENSNVIGYVDAAGMAHSSDGAVIGSMMPDGSVVDANGKLVGGAVDYGYVYDSNGNIIGRVTETGDVVDLDGNVIGRLNDKGEVVDVNGNVIGWVAKSGDVVFDENGNPIGVVMPNGDVVNMEGDVIGRINENGDVTSSSVIGKRGQAVQMALDENGNIIGYIGEDGKVYDFDGNEIGRVDENGNVVDAEGKIIGKVSDEWHDLAVDENGKPIGWIDENGNVIGKNGNIIGVVNSDGTITASEIFGQKGESAHLAFDKNGNVIGYIGEDGKVYDFNGKEIGRVDENGNVVDANGNVIGTVSKELYDLAEDRNGRGIGWIDKDGDVYVGNKKVGFVDVEGNLRSFGTKIIGSLINKNLLPITPEGNVLGVLNNVGEIISQQKAVGKMRPNGIVTDMSGANILAVGVNPGYIVNWGCDFKLKLDKDGVVRQDGVETNYRVFSDGTVWSQEGDFMGRTVKTGSVYDDECRYVGEAYADGYVRDAAKKEIGCLNPDGTVLDLEEPRIKGHIVEQKAVYSSNWQKLGYLDANGTLKDASGNIIGCANSYGDVFDRDMAYIGSVSNAKYAFDFDGNLLGIFDHQGNIDIAGTQGAHLFLHKYVADYNNQIIGYAADDVSILTDADGKRLGNLFPNGYVYDNLGVIIDKINGGENGFYNNNAARFLYPSFVVGTDGKVMGYVSYDQKVVKFDGRTVGKVNAQGYIFDDNGRQIGGKVKQGSVRGYDGMYLGYVVRTGDVVELEDMAGENGRGFHKGDITGNVLPSGHIIKEGRIVGEVLPQDIMVDILGNYVGFSNNRGFVVDKDGSNLSALLPGGTSIDDIVPMQRGFVVDFSGKLIGIVLPDGRFMDDTRMIVGRVLADGKVISNDGKILGEVVSGDIVIGNDDKVRGLVGFDGKVYKNGNVVGKILPDGLAADLQNNVIGHVYTIGNSVLSNNGDYIGRLSANGRVLDISNMEVGYIKSNGSFIDTDKNVSGYILPEVAKNRRN